jgi:excisionase family DNA binding protein
MLLTIKDLSAWLNIKPSTLYLWAAQGKIPCKKIHGLIRFDRDTVTEWLESFERNPARALPPAPRVNVSGLDQLIEAVKRDAYTSSGETRPTASPKGRR